MATTNNVSHKKTTITSENGEKYWKGELAHLGHAAQAGHTGSCPPNTQHIARAHEPRADYHERQTLTPCFLSREVKDIGPEDDEHWAQADQREWEGIRRKRVMSIVRDTGPLPGESVLPSRMIHVEKAQYEVEPKTLQVTVVRAGTQVHLSTQPRPDLQPHSYTGSWSAVDLVRGNPSGAHLQPGLRASLPQHPRPL